MDVVVAVEIQKLFASKLGAIIRDDTVGYPKAVDDIGEKEHSLFGPNTGDGASLDPLGEFVNGDEQVGEAAGCSFQRFDKITPPNGKRPRDGNGL
jgi:hypothetical protein